MHYRATITNTPGGPNNTLVIHKTAIGNTNPDESYWFTLTLKEMRDKAYALKVNGELIPIYRNADDNPEVRFSLKHNETATVEGLPDNFDKSHYELVEEPGNYTTTMYHSVTANEDGAGNIYTVEVVNACFDPATVTIPIQKFLEGRDVQKDDYFRFEILKCDADESPEDGAAELPYDIICLHMGATEEDLESTIVEGDENTITVNGVKKKILHVAGEDVKDDAGKVIGKSASFQLGGTVGETSYNGFKLPGEYHYTVHELPNDNFPGVSIDPTRYHVIIDVRPDENEPKNLNASISDIWSWDGVNRMGWNKTLAEDSESLEKLLPITFTNRFQTTEVTRYFETQKTLVNGHLQPGQFSFLLEETGVLPWSEDYKKETKSETAETLSTLGNWKERENPVSLRTSNGDSGLVQFEGVTYKLADAGENPETGMLYAYTLREEIPEGAVKNADGNWVYNNITYSEDVKHVYVHVSAKEEPIEGMNTLVVHAEVYSTSEENKEAAENGEIYYISGFTNTYTPPRPTTTSLEVVKVWNDSIPANEHNGVTVGLYNSAGLQEYVTLNADNNWRHEWTGLAIGETWRVEEVSIPGYTGTQTRSGNTVTITNTPEPENPPTTPPTTPPGGGGRPTPPPVVTELPDPNVPGAPEEVTVIEEDVPRTYVKIWDPENEEYVYIPEDEVPLADMTPETGDNRLTALWQTLCLSSMAGLGALYATKPRKKDETL